MSYQSIFKRREVKYLLSDEQMRYIVDSMEEHMKKDKFFHSSIRNIYFDTDDFRLIRRSLEKPHYKEKLRIRSYGKCDAGSEVFVELKKKYDSIVYKRRLSMSESDAMRWFMGDLSKMPKDQIGREIEYCRNYYGELKPAVFLSYERDSYASRGDDGLRITFDRDILSRRYDMSLQSETEGSRLIGENQVLMEIKSGPGLPLWMTSLLTEAEIHKTSFSKYGTAYKKYIWPELKENRRLITAGSADIRQLGSQKKIVTGGYKYA